MDVFLTMLASAAVGIVVGMLSGMLGVGGGTVLVPIFKLGYGMSAITSTATSLFTIIPTSLTGAVAHVWGRTCIPLLGIAAGVGGAITSPVGVWLASMSPEWTIMVAAALIIGYSAVTMFGKALKLRRSRAGGASSGRESSSCRADAGGSGTSESAVLEKPSVEEKSAGEMLSEFKASVSAGRQILVGGLVGLFAGLVSGYVGVGGGFIMVPLFMQLLGTPMKITSGTSLIAVMILAIPGTVTQGLLGNVDWISGMFIALGAVPGAAIGAKIMPRMSELALRFGFAAFLLVAALLLVLNQVGAF